MTGLRNKIDFAVLFSVENANPNGDPLNGNRPRINYDGYGEVSDVAIKRKIRNRLMEMKYDIFVQSDDNRVDEFKTLKERYDYFMDGHKDLNKDQTAKITCEKWMDVRSFGQVFAFKSKAGKGQGDGVSIGIRGPVSIHPAFSLDPVSISSVQITKSVSSEGDGTKKSSDTMGMKHRVDKGTYVFYGSINPQLASKTGFSEDDAQAIKDCLLTLFENDASSARPEGSMDVRAVYWWAHKTPNGEYSSRKVHSSLKIVKMDGKGQPGLYEDYEVKLESLDGLTPEILTR